MQKRRRVRQTISLQERLAQRSAQLRLNAEQLPPGEERDRIISAAKEVEAASHLTKALDIAGR